MTIEEIAKKEVYPMYNDTRKDLIALLRSQILQQGSPIHCFLEWLDLRKEDDIICIRQP